MACVVGISEELKEVVINLEALIEELLERGSRYNRKTFDYVKETFLKEIKEKMLNTVEFREMKRYSIGMIKTYRVDEETKEGIIEVICRYLLDIIEIIKTRGMLSQIEIILKSIEEYLEILSGLSEER